MKQVSDIESPESFFLQAPLYTYYSYDGNSNKHAEIILQLVDYGKPIDAYCPFCQKDSPFLPNRSTIDRHISEFNPSAKEELRAIDKPLEILNTFICPRGAKLTNSDSHNIQIRWILHRSYIVKIMQYPSTYDISAGKIKKYNGILADYHSEFSRAISLASNGVSIGAFVYLRRILEKLVEDAHTIEKQTPEWNEDEYNRSRFQDKIKSLSHQLPAFLVDNAKIYGLISKGVHELSEGECASMYPIMETSIELILNQKLHDEEQKEKEIEARANIQKLLGDDKA